MILIPCVFLIAKDFLCLESLAMLTEPPQSSQFKIDAVAMRRADSSAGFFGADSRALMVVRVRFGGARAVRRLHLTGSGKIRAPV
jgi:hypothetical protein